MTVFDNLTSEMQNYLENLGYSPIAQIELVRKPDLSEYNNNPVYQKWFDAGEIVGIWEPEVTGYIWKK